MNHTGLPCQTLEVDLGMSLSISSRRRSQIARSTGGWAFEYSAICSAPSAVPSTLFDLVDFFIVNSPRISREHPEQEPLTVPGRGGGINAPGRVLHRFEESGGRNEGLATDLFADHLSVEVQGDCPRSLAEILEQLRRRPLKLKDARRVLLPGIRQPLTMCRVSVEETRLALGQLLFDLAELVRGNTVGHGEDERAQVVR